MSVTLNWAVAILKRTQISKPEGITLLNLGRDRNYE